MLATPPAVSSCPGEGAFAGAWNRNVSRTRQASQVARSPRYRRIPLWHSRVPRFPLRRVGVWTAWGVRLVFVAYLPHDCGVFCIRVCAGGARWALKWGTIGTLRRPCCDFRPLASLCGKVWVPAWCFRWAAACSPAVRLTRGSGGASPYLSPPPRSVRVPSRVRSPAVGMGHRS